MESLVTTDWLEKELGASDLRIVDATKLPADLGRDARVEYESWHVPGATFMDLAELVDSANPIENMLPPPEKFASRMQTLGLGDGSRIVLYDDSPHHTAARAWWMLNVFGAHDVAILDGGLAKWKAEARPLDTGNHTLRHRHFTVWKNNKLVRTKEQMLANLESKAEEVVDARPPDRFAGDLPDLRPGNATGHIPGSRNVPANSVFNPDGTYKSEADIEALFHAAGVDMTKPMVTTCGSGITACVVAFAAHLVGKRDIAVYDGSWAEWGSDPNTPKATGPA